MASSVALPTMRTQSGGQRWRVAVLTGLALVAYAVTLFVPWWRITLLAPQYPRGLTLTVGLSGFAGDAREVDLLNHYIGMSHLEEAAPLERQLAAFGVIAIALVAVAAVVLARRRIGALFLVPLIAFPVVFLIDSFYWMYRFGHDLNPKAPVHIPPFTPRLFGTGNIGQFHTTAYPHIGFVLALLALGLIIGAYILRRRQIR